MRIFLFSSVMFLLMGCTTFSQFAEEPVIVDTATAVPATILPEPTAVPPTAVPPTEIPPTAEPTAVPEPTAVTFELADETAVLTIPLTEPLGKLTSEVSGMAWYGEWLIIMPQYPLFSRQGEDGVLYALHKDEIEAFINGGSDAPLDAQPIPFHSSTLRHKIAGFEGYESIAFDGDSVYMTVEANQSGMHGYLVRGTIEPDLSGITIYAEEEIAYIPPQTSITNFSDESVLLVGDQLLTMYESNGLQYNPNPVAHVFGTDLSEQGTIPFPRIEFRVTDATELDENGRFWVINYNYPGDNKVQTDDDPLAAAYGKGATHAASKGVERLVELQYSPDGISLTDTPPVQLEMLPTDNNNYRNWEGIVRFNDGWLIITDRYPGTIFGYVSGTEK